MTTDPHPPAPAPRAPRRNYRHYDLVMAAFVVVLLCSNLIGPAKSCRITLPLLGWPLIFGAGNIFFPFSYIFGDILTEVYGYARSRRVIWAGFAALLFYVVMSQVVINMPANDGEPFNKVLQPALELVFGPGPRIVGASLLAFWCGDFANSYVLAKMKVWTQGRHMWSRFVGSTIIGQAVDSIIFYPLAFASLQPLADKFGLTLPVILQGGWTAQTVLVTVFFQWLIKVCVEIGMIPFTYLITNFLKRSEQEDYFDTNTDFNPFRLHV